MPHAVAPSEIRPGLVIRLDTSLLREQGAETNAQRSGAEDRAVTGVHDFLVVAVDARAASCIAVPLFPKTAPGSSPLHARHRAGDAGDWANVPAFYSRWQHWRIPLAAVAGASADDPGAPGARRSYGAGDADTLQEIANWAWRNRNAYRPA